MKVKELILPFFFKQVTQKSTYSVSLSLPLILILSLPHSRIYIVCVNSNKIKSMCSNQDSAISLIYKALKLTNQFM